MTNLQHILSPYLFPLLIEFSVVAATMTMGMWEDCVDLAFDVEKSIYSANSMVDIHLGESFLGVYFIYLTMYITFS